MNARFYKQKKRVIALVVFSVLIVNALFGFTQQVNIASAATTVTTVTTVTTNSTPSAAAGGSALAQSSNTGQVAAYNNGQGATSSPYTGAGSIGSCIGSAASAYISKYTSSFLGNADQLHVRTQGQADAAHPGASVNGYQLPGWDGIGFCIGNALITYIGQSLVQWINSGFNGNPAFIANPQQFFENIANVEAGTFINTLVAGQTGLNLCQPLRNQIGLGLLNQYSRASPLTCTLTQLQSTLSNPTNYQLYTNNSMPFGTYSNNAFYANWQGMALSPQNTYMGGTLVANQQMQAAIAQQQQIANTNLNWSRGYLPIQSCPPTSATANSAGGTTQVSHPCQTTTPGQILESKINNTLNNGNNRLVIATQFDQIVSALIGQLVSVGLSHVLSH